MSSCSLSMKSATRGLVLGRWCASRVVMAECVDDGGIELGLRIDCVVDISERYAAWTSAWRAWDEHGECRVGPELCEVLVLRL